MNCSDSRKPVDEQREATRTDNGVDVNCVKAKHHTLAQIFSSDDALSGNGLYPSSAAETVLSIRTLCPQKDQQQSPTYQFSPENDLGLNRPDTKRENGILNDVAITSLFGTSVLIIMVCFVVFKLPGVLRSSTPKLMKICLPFKKLFTKTVDPLFPRTVGGCERCNFHKFSQPFAHRSSAKCYNTQSTK